MADAGLADEPFAFRRSGDDRIFITYRGRHVVTLAGREARRFLDRAQGRQGEPLQLLLAKVTGNFKRGNERPGR